MKPPTVIVCHSLRKSKMYANLPEGFYNGDWQLREFPKAHDIFDVQSYRMDGVTMNGDEPGLWYTSELAGSAGASFIIFREEKHTADDVRIAKRYLRQGRDVVGRIQVIHI